MAEANNNNDDDDGEDSDNSELDFMESKIIAPLKMRITSRTPSKRVTIKKKRRKKIKNLAPHSIKHDDDNDNKSNEKKNCSSPTTSQWSMHTIDHGSPNTVSAKIAHITKQIELRNLPSGSKYSSVTSDDDDDHDHGNSFQKRRIAPPKPRCESPLLSDDELDKKTICSSPTTSQWSMHTIDHGSPDTIAAKIALMTEQIAINLTVNKTKKTVKRQNNQTTKFEEPSIKKRKIISSSSSTVPTGALPPLSLTRTSTVPTTTTTTASATTITTTTHSNSSTAPTITLASLICIDCDETGHATKRSKFCKDYNFTPLERKFGINANLHRYTIQMGLNALCDNELIKNEIKETVKEMSRLSIEKSFHFEYLLRHQDRWLLNEIISSTTLPRLEHIGKFLHQKYKPRKKNNDTIVLEKLTKEFRKINCGKNEERRQYDCTGRSPLFEEEYKIFITNFANNIKIHAVSRIRKFILKKLNKENEEKNERITWYEANKMASSLFINGKIDEKLLTHDLFIKHKNLKFQTFFDKWWQFLEFFMDLQKYIKFKLVPIQSPGLKFQTITTSGVFMLLRKLFKDDGVQSNRARALEDDDKVNEMWYKLLPKLKNYKRIQNNFAYSISTNGICVSIHCARYIKNVKDIYQKNINIDDYSRIYAFDPGVIYPFGGICVDNINDIGDKKKEKIILPKATSWRYRTGQYHRKYKLYNLGYDKIEKYLEDLNKINEFKDINLDDPLNYINITKYRLKWFDKAQVFFERRKIARLSWNSKINDRQEVSRFINYIKFGQQRYHPNKKDQSKHNKTKYKYLQYGPKTEQQVLRNNKKIEYSKIFKLKIAEKHSIKSQKKIERRDKIMMKIKEKKKISKPAKTDPVDGKELKKKKTKKLKKNRLIQPRNTGKVLVFIGKVEMPSGIKGHVHAPICRLTKELSRCSNVDVVLVNEFNTTKLCCVCGQRCFVSISPDRYVYCKKCKKSSNRDINAARNIMNLALVDYRIKPISFINNYFSYRPDKKNNNNKVDNINNL